MFSAFAALIQFILALFRRVERKDMEEAGAARAEAETAKRVEKMVKDGQEAAKKADKSPEFTTNDPNNRLRR